MWNWYILSVTHSFICNLFTFVHWFIHSLQIQIYVYWRHSCIARLRHVSDLCFYVHMYKSICLLVYRSRVRRTHIHSFIHALTRDGPKFGRRRSSAEEFGRMFSSVRLGNVRLFGRSSAELWQTFGVIGASNWQRFALAAGVNQSQYTYY